MNFSIFEQIGAVPEIISSFKRELIGMQYYYALEKIHTLRDFRRNGIATRGNLNQYDEINKKLESVCALYERNIHNILSEDEIKLLGPDSYLETNYSLWYKNNKEFE